MKEFFKGIGKWIAEKAKTIYSHISGYEKAKVQQNTEREKREAEKQSQKEVKLQEKIDKWREMIWELRQKNKSEQGNSKTNLKDLLEGHKDYDSLYKFLSDETKSEIDFGGNSRLDYVKDKVIDLIARDIDILEIKWGLTP